MSCQIEYRDSGFIITHTGTITIGEINQINERIQNSEHFDDHTHQVVDLLQADFKDIVQSHSKMPAVTDAVASSRKEDVKVAMVATDPLAISFCEKYVKSTLCMGGSWGFAIFPDMDSALQWAKGDG